MKPGEPIPESHQGAMEGFSDGRTVWAGSCSEEGLLGREMGEGAPEGSDPWREQSPGV